MDNRCYGLSVLYPLPDISVSLHSILYCVTWERKNDYDLAISNIKQNKLVPFVLQLLSKSPTMTSPRELQTQGRYPDFSFLVPVLREFLLESASKREALSFMAPIPTPTLDQLFMISRRNLTPHLTSVWHLMWTRALSPNPRHVHLARETMSSGRRGKLKTVRPSTFTSQ